MVSYIAQPDSLYVFVSHDTKVEAHILHLPGDFESLVLRFVRHCANPASPLEQLDVEGNRLYAILVAPLGLEISGVTSLLIEADGLLDRVPFDLLRKSSGPYLGEQFKLAYSPGLAYLRSARNQNLTSRSKAVVVVPTGQLGIGWPSLPEAEAEGAEVNSFFQEATMLSGVEASRDAVIRALPQARVFHFSGHAIANVVSVGLVLRDGARLEAADLSRLDIRNMQLAVLSGCDTASGGSGSYSAANSLARTLMAGGARQVVASRWQVDSLATRILMRDFYSNLVSGKSAADSLRAAKTTLRDTPGYRHPYYWASFTIFGN